MCFKVIVLGKEAEVSSGTLYSLNSVRSCSQGRSVFVHLRYSDMDKKHAWKISSEENGEKLLGFQEKIHLKGMIAE